MCHVYRCYDKDLNLLYIGSSMFFLGRIQSLRQLHWFKHVVYIRLEKFRAKRRMIAAELAAIQSEQPKFNVVGTQGYKLHKKNLLAIKESLVTGKLKADKRVMTPVKMVGKSSRA